MRAGPAFGTWTLHRTVQTNPDVDGVADDCAFDGFQYIAVAAGSTIMAPAVQD